MIESLESRQYMAQVAQHFDIPLAKTAWASSINLNQVQLPAGATLTGVAIDWTMDTSNTFTASGQDVSIGWDVTASGKLTLGQFTSSITANYSHSFTFTDPGSQSATDLHTFDNAAPVPSTMWAQFVGSGQLTVGASASMKVATTIEGGSVTASTSSSAGIHGDVVVSYDTAQAKPQHSIVSTGHKAKFGAFSNRLVEVV